MSAYLFKNEGSDIREKTFLRYISALLAVPQDQLEATLLVKTMTTGGDTLKIPLKVEQAIENRDSMCKVILLIGLSDCF